MFKAGIVERAKVTPSALQNAASIAGMVLTTECIVVDKPEPKECAAAGAGAGIKLAISITNREFDAVEWARMFAPTLFGNIT